MAVFLCPRTQESDTKILTVMIVSLVCFVAFFVTSLFLLYKNNSERVFFVPPFTSVFLILNTLALAIPSLSGYAGRSGSFGEAVYVLQSILPLIFLVQLFELTAIAHKNRGVNFCFLVKYEEFGAAKSHRRLAQARLGYYLAVSLVFLITIGIEIAYVSNLDGVKFETNSTEYVFCLRGAFVPLLYNTTKEGITNPAELVDFPLWLQYLSSTIQPVMLSLAGIYFGALLWRYGTFYSFRVYPTYFNPWLSLFFFSLLQLLSLFILEGGVLQPVCIIILQGTCVFIQGLCVDELEQEKNIQDFLKRGDASSEDANSTEPDAEKKSLNKVADDAHVFDRESAKVGVSKSVPAAIFKPRTASSRHVQLEVVTENNRVRVSGKVDEDSSAETLDDSDGSGPTTSSSQLDVQII